MLRRPQERTDNWLIQIDRYLQLYVTNIFKAANGNNPSFAHVYESTIANQEFVKYLSKAQKYFEYMYRQIQLSQDIPIIDEQTVPPVYRNTNQYTVAMRQLQKDLQTEENIFKKCVLQGTITAYQIALKDIRNILMQYNTAQNTQLLVPDAF